MVSYLKHGFQLCFQPFGEIITAKEARKMFFPVLQLFRHTFTYRSLLFLSPRKDKSGSYVAERSKMLKRDKEKMELYLNFCAAPELSTRCQGSPQCQY